MIEVGIHLLLVLMKNIATAHGRIELMLPFTFIASAIDNKNSKINMHHDIASNRSKITKRHEDYSQSPHPSVDSKSQQSRFGD